MSNQGKWNKISDWTKYQKEIYEATKSSNPILEMVDLSKVKVIDNTNSLINGVPFSLKNNFNVEGHSTSGGSKLLKNFTPNYNSTVFEKLIAAGSIPLFLANLDELAMGGTGLSSGFGEVKNPRDNNRMTGGSSSGGAFQVANGDVAFSIGSDTGDSVRKPASYVGVVGYKPTWGIVSRDGMFDFAPSYDAVSWFTKTVQEAAYLLDVLQGHDANDYSSVVPKQKDYLMNLNTDKKFKLTIIKNIINELKDPLVKQNWENTISLLKNDGHTIDEVEIDINILNLVLPMYRVITSVEAFSCNSNLSGFLFGEGNVNDSDFETLLNNTRTENFNYEVKKRFLFANYAIHNTTTYRKALAVRTLLIKRLNEIFAEYDGIIMPAAPTVAPLIEDYKAGNISSGILEDYLAMFNANGSPSLTIPNYDQENSLPTGVNISFAPFKDLECLQLGNIIEKLQKK